MLKVYVYEEERYNLLSYKGIMEGRVLLFVRSVFVRVGVVYSRVFVLKVESYGFDF